jgi:ATP-dependent DNA ligase
MKKTNPLDMRSKTFPTLYKKSSQGKIEEWTVQVIPVVGSNKKVFQVLAHYGEHKGKLQNKSFLIAEGKNSGKVNQTTPFQQALKEAEAKFNKKLKSGYVKSLKDAQAGKVDKVIKGGIVPMLALKWQNYAERVMFPVMVQPKLDGERCIAIYENGKVTLWTRTRKPITACPHIINQLETALRGSQSKRFLDGELYKHGLTAKERTALMGAVRKQKPSELSLQAEFHIYDGGLLGARDYSHTFEKRWYNLGSIPDWHPHIKFVTTKLLHSEDKIRRLFRVCLTNGYEGVMVRDPFSEYHNKRSKALLKYKPRDDAEFKIVDIEEGKDNTVVFKCITEEGNTFGATKDGDKQENQKYLKNKKKFIGKLMTVEFQGYSGKKNVPLFPTAVRLREE